MRHPARRRPQPEHVAEARRVAQRATHVAAVGERPHAGRERDGGAAAAPAAGPGGVVGVAGRPEQPVGRLRPGPELRHVGLAHPDAAGHPHPRREHRVLGRHHLRVDRRPPRRAHPGGRQQVLVRHRQPVQQPYRTRAQHVRVELVGAAPGRVVVAGHQRVEHRVDGVGPVEAGVEQLSGRQLPAPEQAGERHGGQQAEIVDHGRSVRLRPAPPAPPRPAPPRRAGPGRGLVGRRAARRRAARRGRAPRAPRATAGPARSRRGS